MNATTEAWQATPLRIVALLLLLLGLALLLALRAPPEPRSAALVGGTSSVSSDYGELPLAFEPNAGRHPAAIDFFTATPAGAIALTERGAVISERGERGDPGAAIAMTLPAAELTRPQPLERLPGVVNDLRGNDPSAWRTEIPTYGRVRYRDAYPGIDLDYRGSGRALEYDFRLAPGADPGLIGLRFPGADSVRIAPAGGLVVRAGDSTLRQRPPLAYQPGVAGRERVASAFVRRRGEIGFRLGAYDGSRPLVIDPLVLEYSTYLGGSGIDIANAIAVDSTGAAYIAGETDSTDFDALGAYETDPGDGSDDVFVTKLNPAGDALVYSTYIGGSSGDQAYEVAVDASGAAYVTGGTYSTDFDTDGTPIQTDPGDAGAPDAFVTKLSPAGSALAYSTYLGGDGSDVGFGIAIDSTGAAYVTGETNSSDFPEVGSIEGDEASTDAFVSKINPGGTALAYSTYLGGAAGDTAYGIAVDASGAAYLIGLTNSADFNTVGPIEGDSPSGDVFVSKLNAAGSALAYSTYLGGNDADFGTSIAVDSAGAAYAAGFTNSTDFDTVGPIETDANDYDAFVFKLTPAGDALTYSTYLGGDAVDLSEAIAVDSSGAAHVAGSTDSTDFNLVGEFEGDSAGSDAFVSKLTPAGSALSYSTYLGGDGSEYAFAIALDSAGAAYVAGETDSTDFDTVGPYEGDSGTYDAFVSKLEVEADPPPPPPPPPPELPPPVQGEKVNAEPVSGAVLVKLPGSGEYIALEEAAQLPTGTIFDLRDGKVRLISSAKGEATRSVLFWGGIVKVKQPARDGAYTEAILVGPLENCGKGKGKGGKGRRRGGSRGRKVWGKGGKGHKSSGNKSSGSVRGTWWLVADLCNGKTRTFVKEGKVEVRDFKRKRTVIVRKGESYLAPGPKRKG